MSSIPPPGIELARREPMDIEEMRRMVAEELARALAGRPVVSSAAAPPVEDIEGKYGAKLDRMLGGSRWGGVTLCRS